MRPTSRACWLLPCLLCVLSALVPLSEARAQFCYCCEFGECLGRSPNNGGVDPSAQYEYEIILRDDFCNPIIGYPAANVELTIMAPCAHPVVLNPAGPSDAEGRMIWTADILEQGGGACAGPDVASVWITGNLFYTLNEVHSPDVDGDGSVALPDLVQWQVSFASQSQPFVGNLDCDSENAVALSDLLFWQKHFFAR